MKPHSIVLSGVGKGLKGGDGRGNLTNVQGKAIQNYHNESLCTMNIC
jgi:hypothetical protein